MSGHSLQAEAERLGLARENRAAQLNTRGIAMLRNYAHGLGIQLNRRMRKVDIIIAIIDFEIS